MMLHTLSITKKVSALPTKKHMNTKKEGVKAYLVKFFIHPLE